MDNRKLIDYLPQVLKDVREYRSIVAAEEPELVDLWTALENALKDNFIDDTAENGVLRLENILKISPKATDNLGDRKFRIKARFNEQLPYTFRTLQKRLAILCGENGYTCELLNETYILKVRIELVVKGQYDAVDNLLERIVPANLVIDLDLMYNQHQTLANFTHEQLSVYTHEQIREEAISASHPIKPRLLDANLIINKTFENTENWVGVYTSDLSVLNGKLQVTGNNSTSIRAYNDNTDMTGAQERDVYFMMLHVKPTNGTPSEISLKYRANGDGDRTLKSTSNITLGQVHELYGMAALEPGMPGMDRVAIYNTYPSGADHIYYIMGYDKERGHVPVCINLSRFDRDNGTDYVKIKTADEIASMIHEELK